MSKKTYVIAGIGTDVGKTIVSAVLVEKLKADYWKPIQAGSLGHTDTMHVEELVSNSVSKIHPESYLLSSAMSPHAAAELENLTIDLDAMHLPETQNTLIIEPAGGLMVPLNKKHFVLDLILKFDTEVILVSKHYLGSINHTLLSTTVLESKGVKVRGIIFNGNENKFSEEIILHESKLRFLGRLNDNMELTKQGIINAGQLINL